MASFDDYDVESSIANLTAFHPDAEDPEEPYNDLDFVFDGDFHSRSPDVSSRQNWRILSNYEVEYSPVPVDDEASDLGVVAFAEREIKKKADMPSSKIRTEHDGEDSIYAWEIDDRNYKLLVMPQFRFLQVVKPNESADGIEITGFLYLPDGILGRVFRINMADNEIESPDDNMLERLVETGEIVSDGRLTVVRRMVDDEEMGVTIPTAEDDKEFLRHLFSILGRGPYAEGAGDG